jgi:hypothetical protein
MSIFASKIGNSTTTQKQLKTSLKAFKIRVFIKKSLLIKALVKWRFGPQSGITNAYKIRVLEQFVYFCLRILTILEFY